MEWLIVGLIAVVILLTWSGADLSKGVLPRRMKDPPTVH
jgi:hypothetical protein